MLYTIAGEKISVTLSWLYCMRHALFWFMPPTTKFPWGMDPKNCSIKYQCYLTITSVFSSGVPGSFLCPVLHRLPAPAPPLQWGERPGPVGQCLGMPVRDTDVSVPKHEYIQS